MKGLNEQQIIPLTKWALQQGFELRFIEFMPLDGDQNWSKAAVVTEQDILDLTRILFLKCKQCTVKVRHQPDLT